MKNVKKIVAVMMMVVMGMMSLTGCGSDAHKIEGEWVFSAEDSPEGYENFSFKYAPVCANGDCEVTFFSNGVIQIENDGFDPSTSNRYAISDGKMQFIFPLGTVRLLDYSIKGKKLTLTDDEGYTAVFIKK